MFWFEWNQILSNALQNSWRCFKERWCSFCFELKEIKTKSLSKMLSQMDYRIGKIALIVPVSIAWPERGASSVKQLKTRMRSTINMALLNTLLILSINGPSLKTKISAENCGESSCKLWVTGLSEKQNLWEI